jgi:hypothetical protein
MSPTGAGSAPEDEHLEMVGVVERRLLHAAQEPYHAKRAPFVWLSALAGPIRRSIPTGLTTL